MNRHGAQRSDRPVAPAYPSRCAAVSDLVSIIMPVYNGEAFLAEAIRSVINQSYSDWELIVVDDGSTDATPRIVAEADDVRIRYARQQNRGQAAALNRGLDLARGIYVTTLDADDRLTPDSLLGRVRWLEGHSDHGAVYADGYICSATLEPLLRFSQHRTANVVGDIYPALISTPLFGTGACVLIRADVLHRWSIRYDETIVMCQDWDFYIRVAEHVQFGYVDAISVYYRVHPMNMTLTIGRERHIDSIARTRFKILDSPRLGTLESATRREFLRRFLINTLKDRPTDQDAVLRSPGVTELPPVDRVRLLRWLATEWLLAGRCAGRVEELLRAARALAPRDAKTAGLDLLVRNNSGLARRALRAWRLGRPGAVLSSFRLATGLRKVSRPAGGPWQ
jgi:glycosyltransferase involved in cell wall biosynthesis